MELDQSDHPRCSYDPLVLTVRRILGEEREHMVSKTCSQVSKMASRGVPVTEDLIRRMVIEGFQPDEERLWCEGTRNEFPEERNLQLKFLDNKVANTVTGDEFKGLKDEFLKLALLDLNEHTVTCGPGSSAKVDILLLEYNGGGDESNMTREKFERSIIQKGDSKKPHISPKSGDIFLMNGVADLKGIKLGHNEDWTKVCNCRLGARIGQNLEGTTVHEAWTSPFKIRDKRHKQYGKHPYPYLTSEVWRLTGISRKGKHHERLEKNHIKTVQDFLFWYHVNPEELQNKILDVSDGIWKTIVSHAQKCNIDCEKMFYHRSSTEPQRCVIYNCVGKLKGEMESQFVGIDNLSADRKDDALKLLRSVLQKASALYDAEKEFQYPITNTICDDVPSDPLRSRDMGEADTEKLLPSSFQNRGQVNAFEENIFLQEHPAGVLPYSDKTEVGGSSSGIHLDISLESADLIMNLLSNPDPQSTPFHATDFEVGSESAAGGEMVGGGGSLIVEQQLPYAYENYHSSLNPMFDNYDVSGQVANPSWGGRNSPAAPAYQTDGVEDFEAFISGLSSPVEGFDELRDYTFGREHGQMNAASELVVRPRKRWRTLFIVLKITKREAVGVSLVRKKQRVG